MFQIVVFPPEETRAAVEPFRRLHDPAFHRIAPHVPLVPPFDADDPRALARRFAAFRADGLPPIAFGAPRCAGPALCLPVDDADGRLAALVRSLRDDVLPLAARMQENAEAPALRIGLLSSDAERELARRTFESAAPALPPFRPDAIVLLMEDVRGLWHEVARRPW